MADFPVLSINPTYPMTEDREDSTYRSGMEGGYELTRPKYTRVRKKFFLKYEKLPDTDKTTLESFVGTVKGGANSFNWTHPKTATVYIVRFDKPPKFEYEDYTFWRTDFQLNQV